MKSKKKWTIILLIIVGLLIILISILFVKKYLLIENSENKKIDEKENINLEATTITISAVGDCTLANDSKLTDGWNYFNTYLKDEDYGYYFRGVYDILSQDDLTIANLEGTFTESTERAEKTFNFKNTKDYVKVLTEGSVEIVNTANNHTYDFRVQGYEDTINTLEDANLAYFGYSTYKVMEVKGIKIGFAGLNYYDEKNYENYKEEINAAITYLKEEHVDLIIFNFHWGIEATYQQTNMQTEVGHYAIDNGADLVLGHHPHRIQGIELYKDKYIVYSLSNFVFGGHRNPSDKDSFIYQQSFTFKNNTLTDSRVNIVPVRISGKNNLNNYQPIIAEEEAKTNIINKINQYSVNFRWENESDNN